MQPATAPAVDVATVHTSRRAPLSRTDGTPIKVIVVDNDRVVAEIVSMALRYEGADVATAADGAGAVSATRRLRPDVAIINPTLTDMNWLRCLCSLRELQPRLLPLVLNAAEGEPDRVVRATAGEHRLTKPFSIEEVLLRMRVMLRNTGMELSHDSVELLVGDLVLNEDSREVTRGGDVIRLSYLEFELLRFFMRNPSRVLTKRQILGRVWPYDFTGRQSVVQLYVSYLRKKVDIGRPPLIHTLRGTGYMLKTAVK